MLYKLYINKAVVKIQFIICQWHKTSQCAKIEISVHVRGFGFDHLGREITF